MCCAVLQSLVCCVTLELVDHKEQHVLTLVCCAVQGGVSGQVTQRMLCHFVVIMPDF
jgi:hypothetical protein